MTQAIALDHVPKVPGPAGKKRPPVLAVGVIIWLGSEFMFFSALFGTFFTIRAHALHWPPPGTDLDYVQASIFSVVLLSSSATMQRAVYLMERGRRAEAKIWLIATFFMGLAFAGNQLYEWITLPFSPSSSVYGSLFFIMSGLHGLHVLLGLVAMLGLLGRIAGSDGDPGEVSVFQGVSYYWHFVDFMWIGLFSCLFLLS
ncbi:MAG: heme-copper oxidase subunit III [Acidimicrobiales bacterium]|nr:heme-copper oxidase subunit III [Acidimicrobiales bacterium]